MQGYSKKESQTRTTTPVPTDAPGKVDVVHAKNSAAVRITLGRVPGAVTYIVQACQGDPNDEAAWTKEWQFINSYMAWSDPVRPTDAKKSGGGGDVVYGRRGRSGGDVSGGDVV